MDEKVKVLMLRGEALKLMLILPKPADKLQTCPTFWHRVATRFMRTHVEGGALTLPNVWFEFMLTLLVNEI